MFDVARQWFVGDGTIDKLLYTQLVLGASPIACTSTTLILNVNDLMSLDEFGQHGCLVGVAELSNFIAT